MHGRVKEKNITEQERLVKQLVREKKLTAFEKLKTRILEKREKGEFDIEALDLTGQLLIAGAADFYTLWNYRCEILGKLCQPEGTSVEQCEKLFTDEIAFNEKCVIANPKSYAIYNHRCWLFDNVIPPSLVPSLWPAELTFTERMLAADERNFHTWDYRRWIFKHWSEQIGESKPSWKSEMDFSQSLIAKNMSNYSAWHYRGKLLLSELETADMKSEFELSNNALYTDPNDQSTWWFYNFLLETCCPSSSWLVSRDVIIEQLQILSELASLEPNNKHAKLTLVRLKRLVAPNEEVGELISLYDELTKIDPTRKNFYADMKSSYIVEQIISKIQSAESELVLRELELTAVPFLKLPKVKRLVVSDNKLVRINRDITSLSECLEEFIADSNLIEDVSAIGRLPNLKIVSLKNNKLDSIDSLGFLDSCKSLEKVTLTGNKFDQSTKNEIMAKFSSRFQVELD